MVFSRKQTTYRPATDYFSRTGLLVSLKSFLSASFERPSQSVRRFQDIVTKQKRDYAAITIFLPV